MSDDLAHAGYQDVPNEEAAQANRLWWDQNAADYLAEHGEFLGPADFRWCPEGLREDEAHLLGPLEDLRGGRVLEIGCGAAQCSRWLRARGVDSIGTDVSGGMLRRAAALNLATEVPVPLVQADARHVPFANASFDVVFTAFGAIPFVAELEEMHREVARVLAVGGRWVFAVTHPLRWAFPDDPTARGLTADRSYFDRAPYVESDAEGHVLYAEYHRTISDHVRALAAAGFLLEDIVEPEWSAGNTYVWGGWGPERGGYLPGTAIFCTHRV